MKNILFLFLILYTVVYGGFFFSDKKKLTEHKYPLMDVPYEKSEALNLLNEIREAMGMNTLVHNDQLEAAAQAHADYIVRNNIASHDEIPGLPGFTGKTPADRAMHAGYLSTQVIENLSAHNADAKTSIDGLFSAIYHRFGFLDTGIDEVGVGVTQNPSDSNENAFVYLMGNAQVNALCAEPSFKGYGRYVYGVCKDHEHRISQKKFIKAKNSNKWLNPKVVLYPYDGQNDVPPAFYEETPDPLPDYDVSGFPVSVVFNDHFFSKVKLLSFSLYEAEKKVKHVRLLTHESDPNGRLTAFQFALLPLERLKYDTSYQAEVVYMEKDRKKTIRWQFHTRVPNERLVKVKQRETTITMQEGESILVYLVPQNGHDVPKHVVFPENANVTFIDNNTLRIHVFPGTVKNFDIESDRYTIHIVVKNSH